ncbi:hypothetical protein CBM2637_B60040 [Cupriavidus taiwanensis]|nr:hypothetical protein CBM2637_B60040 [Cupriavidus taiwanensis]
MRAAARDFLVRPDEVAQAPGSLPFAHARQPHNPARRRQTKRRPRC